MKPTAHPPLQDAASHRLRAAPAADGTRLVGQGHTCDVLKAHTLLAGRPWVTIEHNGQHYRLQTTRAGKLILTK